MTRVEPPLPRWQSLAFPFNTWTWLAILVGLILTGPVFFLLVSATTRWEGYVDNCCANQKDASIWCVQRFDKLFFQSNYLLRGWIAKKKILCIDRQ